MKRPVRNGPGRTLLTLDRSDNPSLGCQARVSRRNRTPLVWTFQLHGGRSHNLLALPRCTGRLRRSGTSCSSGTRAGRCRIQACRRHHGADLTLGRPSAQRHSTGRGGSLFQGSRYTIRAFHVFRHEGNEGLGMGLSSGRGCRMASPSVFEALTRSFSQPFLYVYIYFLKKKRQGQPWGQHTLAPRDSESGIWIGPYRDTLDMIILTGFSGWRQTLEASPSFRPNPYSGLWIFQHRVQHGSMADSLVSTTEPHSHEPEVLRPHSESNLLSIAQSISPYVGSCIDEGTSGGGNNDEQKAAPVPPIIE